MALVVFWPWEKYYSAAPLGGRVVDKDTREPIEGAYVVAIYILRMGMEGGSSTPLHYEETRTDHEGRFHFDGFKKKRVPYERATRNAILSTEDPRIYVFTESYLPGTYTRRMDSRIDRRSHRVSPLDGGDFPITPIGVLPAREQWHQLSGYLGSLSSDLNSTISPATGKSVMCAFNSIPMTRDYFRAESDRLSAIKVNNIILRFNIPQATICFEKEK